MWAFANNDDIRRAIHAEPISKIGRFDECSDRITYTHDTGSMIPIHADLVSKGEQLCSINSLENAVSSQVDTLLTCSSTGAHSSAGKTQASKSRVRHCFHVDSISFR